MQTALITGGSRGIGRATVQQLARDGWRVAFSYLNSQEEALALARETGALALRADLREEGQSFTLVEQALAMLGHLDGAVFNAGVSQAGQLLQDLPTSAWDSLFALNLRGAFLTAQPVIRHMVRRHSGSLVFVSSVWGTRGAACEAAYAASKAGLIGLSQSLAQELGPSGIRVNSIAPGVIDTGMNEGFSPEERAELAGRALLGRLGTPEEVAQSIAFLLGDRAAYITGQVLGVDGGFA